MRDMIELHQPLTRSPVAATFKPQMPPPARDKTEAITRGCNRTDPPPRRRRARFHRTGWPQQQERKAGIAGDEMQPLACLEIESFDRSRDSGRRGRAQGFLDGPKGLSLVRRFDQDHAGRIETEAVEAMTVRAAIPREATGRHDKQQRSAARYAAKKRRDEAEGGRHVAGNRGRDLV
jgi:hypothetical protein